jgi:Fe-S cluster assembly protein SufD
MTDIYQRQFETFEKNLNGMLKSPLHARRREAMAKFREIGFPTTKNEEWRFTNVAPLTKVQFQPATDVRGALTAKEIEQHTVKNLEAARFVFINGVYAPEFSQAGGLPVGVKAGSLAEFMRSEPEILATHLARHAKYEENAFTALSTAFMSDGAFVYVPDGVEVTTPMFLLFLSTADETPFITHPRNLIIAGKGSRVALIENYTGRGHNVYFTNAVTEVVAGAGAVIEHDKIQHESDNAFHVSSLHIVQEEGSSYTSNAITYGGSLVRNNVTSVLDGERCECTLNGLSLGTGNQHIDNHTSIDHAKPNCASHELYKAILEGRSRGVFNGKIFVRKDAQKTDAKQTNKTLLLSDDATIDTKPQLEIFADDVKCTHGATVGQLDEEQIFYLRSRGLALDDARDLLTNAFASDVINRISVGPLRELLNAMLHVRLCKGRLILYQA